ncbi:MAG TPA: hypothetical protein VFW98_17210 [Gemmatimonadaceae bacterium]|nr:hypothetical protein [Gemmatimonadaceae bacterium]
MTDIDGTRYRALIYGEQRPQGNWSGWIEFVPSGDTTLQLGRRSRTGQETSQPDRAALEYWAGGLEPLYLEGALARALRHRE